CCGPVGNRRVDEGIELRLGEMSFTWHVRRTLLLAWRSELGYPTDRSRCQLERAAVHEARYLACSSRVGVGDLTADRSAHAAEMEQRARFSALNGRPPSIHRPVENHADVWTYLGVSRATRWDSIAVDFRMNVRSRRSSALGICSDIDCVKREAAGVLRIDIVPDDLDVEHGLPGIGVDRA